MEFGLFQGIEIGVEVYSVSLSELEDGLTDYMEFKFAIPTKDTEKPWKSITYLSVL